MDTIYKFWFTIACGWCGETVDAGADHGNIYGEFVWLMPICPCCGAGTLIKVNYQDFLEAVIGKEE